jgi:hypothetical protein
VKPPSSPLHWNLNAVLLDDALARQVAAALIYFSEDRSSNRKAIDVHIDRRYPGY